MKAKALIIAILTAISFSIVSCSSENNEGRNDESNENHKEEINILEQYKEPDVYFADAVKNFEKGDTIALLSDLDKAKDFLEKVVYEYDTVHKMEFLESANEINLLKKKIRNSDSVTINDLKRTFSKIDLAIGSYHVAIIEEWVKLEENSEEATVRLKRALIRADNSINYTEIELPDYVMKDLSSVSDEVLKAEKASKQLLEKTKEKIRIFNERMEENSNPLDGSYQ